MTLDQILVLVLLVGVFIAFIREWVPPDMVALSTTAILMATGVLSTGETLEVFSNPGVLTVGAMFVLSAALDRTGCIEALGNASLALVGRSRTVALLGLILFAAMVSAVINNTPVVVILTPVVIRLCHHLKTAPSKMLIPLSYAAVFGGTCTLVGTSTNLLVDSVAQRMGQPAFGLLEIAPLGLLMTGVGALYLLLVSDRLLPVRNTVSDVLSGQPQRQFLTEIMVPADSAVIGKALDEVKLGQGAGARVVDVLRGDESMRRNLPAVRLEAGDRVLLKTAVQGVMDLRERAGVAFESDRFQQVATRRTAIVEGIVGPRSSFVEHKLSHFNLRRRYGVYIVALHRQGVNLRDKFEDVRIEVGDTLLLEGPQDGIRRLVESGDLINLTAPEHHPLRRNKAWIAILALLAVVVLSALNVMPIAGLAIIAAVVVVAAGCLPHADLYKSVDWRILFMIFGMLPLGLALEKTGAVQLVANGFAGIAGSYGPHVVLSMIYLLALVLTEVASNNVVGVLLTPIAISVAQHLGVDPRPFIIAVMFAASSGFATPIGYQTHLFVYGAGGYKYTDFVKIGLPLDLLFWIVGSLAIPLIWPF